MTGEKCVRCLLMYKANERVFQLFGHVLCPQHYLEAVKVLEAYFQGYLEGCKSFDAIERVALIKANLPPKTAPRKILEIKPIPGTKGTIELNEK